MISIITTMYNAERTISKMIESVLSQTYSDFELIIVDDSSKDNSKAIVNGYQDKRIRLVELNDNRGPGPARNKGISLAKGENIAFVDSDDYLESNMLEAMMLASKEADIVVCGYLQEFENYVINVVPKSVDDNPATLDSHKLFSFCWNKLYKTKVIKENCIVFPNIMHSEDFFFNAEYFKYVRNISIVEAALYHYVKPNITTLTTSDYIAGFFDLISLRYQKMLELCSDNSNNSMLANVHLKHVLSALMYNCSEKSGMSLGDRRKFIKKVLVDSLVKEAIENCKSDSKSSLIINSVLCTKNVTIIQSFVFITYLVKTRFQFIFDGLK